MSSTMLPPPLESPSDVPPLVDWDPSTPSWNAVVEAGRDTWRPARFESEASEYA